MNVLDIHLLTTNNLKEMLEEIFCFVDDFCQEFLPKWKQYFISSGIRKHYKLSRMSTSEVMTILIHFHQSHYRNLKHYYLNEVLKNHCDAFPTAVSYNHFLESQKSVLVPLCFLIHMFSFEQTGIYFIDSTTIKVCHIKREKQHKVFDGLAEKSRSTMGYFYGFKLHLVINDKGELVAFKLTGAKTNDRNTCS